jgi:hypothetical protein
MTRVGSSRTKDLRGQKFGKLTVLEPAEARPNSTNARWLCQCECGSLCVKDSGKLKISPNISCGCYAREQGIRNLVQATRKHGLCGHPLHKAWTRMKSRCYCPSDHAHRFYIGRQVCAEWKDDFMAFFTWSMQHGWEHGFEIDRVENTGDYSPDNCQWLPKSEHHSKTATEQTGSKRPRPANTRVANRTVLQ